MKKTSVFTTLVVLLTMVAVNSFAQTRILSPEDVWQPGMSWTEVEILTDGETSVFTNKLGDMTTINGKEYIACGKGGETYLSLRDNKLFAYLPIEDIEFVVYDFNNWEESMMTQVNSLALSFDNDQYELVSFDEKFTSVEEVSANGDIPNSSVRLFNDPDRQLGWGIGYISTMPMLPIRLGIPIVSVERHFVKEIRNAQGEIIFRHPLWYNSTSIDNITAGAKEGEIFDLMGNRINNPLPGTIYVKDGKKFVR